MLHDIQHHCGKGSAALTESETVHWGRVRDEHATMARRLEAALSAAARAPGALQAAENLSATCSWCGKGGMRTYRKTADHFR